MLRKLIVYLFSFKGRIKRIDWWLGRLGAIFSLCFVAAILGYIFDGLAEVAVGVFVIICIWFQISFSIRRLHDTDRSAWCLLLFIIPFYALIVCGCFGGTEGKNKYG